jgi:hypothetical protein
MSSQRIFVRREDVSAIHPFNFNQNQMTMNRRLFSLCATLLLTTSLSLRADDLGKSKPGSPEFERLKTLAGNWTGKADMGHGPEDLNIEFRLVAGGSALEERSAPGTPMEMVTLFYDKGGKLTLTHYCVFGNRPEMAMKASDAKSITFDLDASCCTFDAQKEAHMHGMKIVFDDPDTVTTHCQAIIDGKDAGDHPITLKRVKADTAAK